MEERVTKLEYDMTDVKTRLAVAEAGLKDMKEDMQSIKNNTTWLLRLVIGAIIGAVLALVLKGGV
ncbi:hemolysin XhlA family protein [Caldifermentibacillus hisashii]|uniref:hemolysin XhlA family protein n=1 Tax=Caldifermentibacillus hisashii TaxID=996558 RepID=UPI0031FD0FD9